MSCLVKDERNSPGGWRAFLAREQREQSSKAWEYIAQRGWYGNESVCVCVCVCMRERQRGTEAERGRLLFVSTGLSLASGSQGHPSQSSWPSSELYGPLPAPLWVRSFCTSAPQVFPCSCSSSPPGLCSSEDCPKLGLQKDT